MAEYVNLIVRVDRSQVNDLQTQINTISGKTVTIKVETIGDTEAIKAAARLESAKAKVATANAKVKASENALAQERERTKQTTARAAAEETKLATQMEKTATAEEQARAANTRLSTQIERTNTVREQQKLQAGKTATAETNLAIQQERTATEAQKAAAAAQRAAAQTQNLGEKARHAAGGVGTLVDRLAKMAETRLMQMGVNAAISGVRDAINTMREVDQELTNISKVSDRTAEDIKRLGDSAYDTASKYGVAAQEYLSAVYTFEKAGLGESSEDMAELATKTMLVGDTTADVASKFLISTNAAWEMNGSMEKLSDVVDKADYINNNYATDLQKLADGMPIVASTASNMNLSFEETIALLGTINSKTQETGRRTATAVRTFLIAISGQVGEFVDDVGETYEVTTENIEALTDALAKYGNDSVKAAIATGQVINPMEALNSLAQAYKDGLLTDIELQDILIKVAGKMRYNQLVTIVKDLASETSTYREMLEGMGDAAGTADNEVTKMIESWNSQTKILKNTWTEFLTNFINSDTFKVGIKALTALIKLLDTGFGRFAIALGLVAVVVRRVVSAYTGLKLSLKTLGARALYTAEEWNALTVAQKNAAASSITAGDMAEIAGMKASAAGTKVASAATKVKAAMGTIGVVLAAIAIGAAIFTAATEAYAKKFKDVEETKEKLNELTQEGGELDNLRKMSLEDMTDADRDRLEILEAQTRELEEQLKKQREIAFEAWRETEGSAPIENPGILGGNDNAVSGYDAIANKAKEARDAVSELGKTFGETGDIEKYRAGLQDLLTGLKDEYNAIKYGILAGVELTEGEQDLYAAYNAIVEELKNLRAQEDAERKAKEAQNGALKSQKDIYDELQPKVQAYIDALNEMETAGGMTDETMRKLIEAAPELSDGLKLTEKGWIANKDAIEKHLEAQLADYQTVLDNAANAAQTILDTEEAKRLEIEKTTGSIYDQITALAQLYALKAEERRAEIFAQYGEDAVSRKIAANDTSVRSWDKLYYQAAKAGVDYKSAEQNLSSARGVIAALRRHGVNSGGGRTGSKTTTDTAREEAQAEEDRADQLARVVSLRKSDLSLLEKSGASVYEQVAVMEQIMDALHAENEYIRSTAEYQEAVRQEQEDASKLTKEQLALLTRVKTNGAEWWDYTEKINKALEGTNTYLSGIKETLSGIQETSLAWLDEQEEAAVGPLQKQLDLLNAQKDATEDAREEQERILAVEEARVALSNAQNERNIRQYNALTGDWEWVANAQTVSDARKALSDAQKSLSDYYRDREIAALEKEISSIQNAYNTLRDAIKNFAKAIDNGTLKFSDAMDYLVSSVSGTGIEDKASKVATDITKSSAATALETMKANGAAWGAASPEVKQWLEETNYKIGTAQGWSRINGAWYDQSGNRLYDSGGILRGMGGVKATRDDEMVLPPKLTSSLLQVEKDGTFESMLNHLGIVTAAAQAYGGFGESVTNNRIGSQHNGDVYEIAGITLSEEQARGMTAYDLAQMARTLSLHNA